MANRTSEIEAKWQERWYSERINESERDSRPKFMIIFAYPGVTGYLHVGHMRGFSYVDAFSRYKRMQGYNVLFPVGTHATGNGAVGLATRIRKKDPGMVEYMLRNGCPEETLEQLTEPRKVVEFFNDVYVNQYWKRFGFLSDWRRFTCTIFPDYGKFIQWQFRKLMEKGLLIQKPYFAPACVNCGPVAIDASETDIMCGGSAETTEYTLMKFQVGDMFLVAATLRPETVFGQTNFWVNPDVEYVKVKHNGEIWVVSAPAAEKMKHQMEDVTVIGTIAGTDLVGLSCTTPMTHREILALPATFCDPNVGTGLVVSVPSDAPDDWMALKTLKGDDEMIAKYGLEPSLVKGIKPIAIIDTKGWGPMPAIEIIEKLGITTAGDPRLEEAKKTVYKEGFHQGRMNQNCGKFSGMSVVQAKDLMKQEMLASNEGALFYDLSEDVVCRCGQPVLIKKVTDQWFIDYANQKFTDMTKEHCKSMHILPGDYYTNVQPVLDWFRERACVRQGNWLGTKFPFDEKWIIEAISDSTLYPVYYLISKYVNSGEIRAEQMTEAFFDLVILGKGETSSVSQETGVPAQLLEHIRADVDYWYPLDLNLGGKEHMTVHFPAFLMNHVAILPKEKWPRGIFVNWYVIGKAGKISKSKGGAQPIPGAAEKYGVDSLRLYYAHIASPFADVEWDEEIVENYMSRLDRIMRNVIDMVGVTENGEMSGIDQWLLSRMASRVGKVTAAMEEFDLRTMSNEVYFETPNDFRWYSRRGGNNGTAVRQALDTWVRMMTPITPHVAEELWSEMGNTTLVSAESYPRPEAAHSALAAEIAEDYLREVMDDTNNILRVTKITPKRIILYTSAAWKYKVYGMALDLHRKGELKIPTLTKAAMADEEIRRFGKEAPDYARKLAEELMKRSGSELERLQTEVDEFAYLSGVVAFLGTELNCQVLVFSADDAGKEDPMNKARHAQPRRPAIYIE